MNIVNLTDEAKRAKIAEACGLREVKTEAWCGSSSPRVTYMPPDGPTNKACRQLVPDYLNDLNAMHEAVKTAIRVRGEVNEYLENLDKIVYSDDQELSEFRLVEATARQRADAFLLTLEDAQ